MKDYLELEKVLGYEFKDKELLKEALIHRSYGNEHVKYKRKNNERLELLGDAVLDLITTEYLYKHFSKSKEGDLAKLKSMAVSEPVLASISKKLGFGKYLFLSKGEEQTGGRERPSILGDVFESILGALYLDSNLERTKEYALKYISYEIDHLYENEALIDFKTKLQEFIQQNHKIVPHYELLEEIGQDHTKEFKVGVYIRNKLIGTGIGKNKKNAEQKAARNACIDLGVKYIETL